MENNIPQVVALGTSIGRSQAFGLITYKCSAEQAKAFEQVWQSGSYKLLGLTWEKYCLDYAGLSHQRVEGIIRNRKEFGDIYLQLSDIIAISPETYRQIQPKVHDDCLEIAGEMVPILPENAARIREASAKTTRPPKSSRPGTSSTWSCPSSPKASDNPSPVRDDDEFEPEYDCPACGLSFSSFARLGEHLAADPVQDKFLNLAD